MSNNQKFGLVSLIWAASALASCSGSGSEQPANPVAPPPASSPSFSIDIMNASTGFMIETGVTGDVELDTYESEIRLAVNTTEALTELGFQLSDTSGSHCPDVQQNDATVPYEFTLDTPADGGECIYTLHGTRTAPEGPIEESLTVDYALSDGSGVGGSERPERWDFTYGTNQSTAYQLGSATTRDAHGNRIYCVISHFSYDDPIVFPGEPGAAHLHMFWGNTALDAHTTSDTILEAGTGSCEGGTDYRVGAWIPAVFNGQDEVVVPEEVFIYYKTFGGPGMRYDLVQPIPQGLGMLASLDTANANDSLLRAGFSDHNGQRALAMNVTFPSCVATENGQRDGQPILDFRDMPGEAANQLNSHVAYPSSGNEVDCPLTHPYRFPTPQFIMFFDADETGETPYLSSDAMAGAAPLSTLHGDYMFGASAEVNQRILQCVQDARSCGFEGGRGQLPGRFLGPAGHVYQSSVELSPATDRTPFGDTLTPVLTQSQSSSAKSHHHAHHHAHRHAPRQLSSARLVSDFDVRADVYTVDDKAWIGSIYNGTVLHNVPNRELFFELTLPPQTSQEIGSVQILINDVVVSVDNKAPFQSLGPADSNQPSGLVLADGQHVLRTRLYEQDDLGGSFLGEWTMTFTLH